MTGRVVIRPGHVRPLWAGHPWVYAQAVERVEGGASPGDEVEVRDTRGNVLGCGYYSPGSAIPVRLLTRGAARIDPSLLSRRVDAAVAHRRDLGLPSAETSAYRVVHAEGDDLPGLVVDRYGDVLCVQLATLGMKQREREVLDALERALRPRAIVDRTSPTAARLERFEAARGVVRGDAGVDALDFTERGFRFRVPLAIAQKTGHYLDQRGLRSRVEALARGRRVLDVHCFTGAFSLAAVRGGATEVLAVDSSAAALEVAAEQLAPNGLEGRVRFECEDALEALARAGRGGGFDLVLVDPPKLAPSRAARERAAAVMQRICEGACRAARAGALVVISSCSAAVDLELLMRSLALAARAVGRRAVVLERAFQGPDHPVPAAFPEGSYLCSLVARVEPP